MLHEHRKNKLAPLLSSLYHRLTTWTSSGSAWHLCRPDEQSGLGREHCHSKSWSSSHPTDATHQTHPTSSSACHQLTPGPAQSLLSCTDMPPKTRSSCSFVQLYRSHPAKCLRCQHEFPHCHQSPFGHQTVMSCDHACCLSV